MAEERKIVEVVRFNPYEKGSFLGFAVVRWENVAFSGVRVFKNKDDEIFIRMPSENKERKEGEPEYSLVWMAYPDKDDNKEAYKMITDAVAEFLSNQEEKPKPKKFGKK